MVAFNFLIGLCCDTDQYASNYQSALMRSFFSEASDFFVAQVSMIQCGNINDCAYNVCGEGDDFKWVGISCDEETVTEVDFYRRNTGSLNVHFLPSTVHTIDLRWCEQSYAIISRRLPQALKDFNMSFNLIEGTIDIPNFPDSIEVIDLQKNSIVGTVDLHILPPKLRRLDLSKNNLKQSTIYYGELPSCMERMSFSKNKVYHVVPLRQKFRTNAPHVRIDVSRRM